MLCIDFLLKYGIILHMRSLKKPEVMLMMSPPQGVEGEFEPETVIIIEGCTCPLGLMMKRSCLGCIPRQHRAREIRKKNPGKKVVDAAEEKMRCTTCNQIKTDRGASFPRVDNLFRDGMCYDCLSTDDSLGC